LPQFSLTAGACGSDSQGASTDKMMVCGMTAVQYPYHMQSGVKSTDKATNQLHLNKNKCLQIAIVIVDFSVKFSIELS